SLIHQMLKNPVYTGRIRHKGVVYDGNHDPLVSDELFEAVQEVFSPRQTGPKRTKHTFALRDFVVCAECGCKVTAEYQKGFTYYRCTKGKGRDACSQRKYTREELLLAQFSEILGSIELTPEIVQMLLRDSRELDRLQGDETATQRTQIDTKIAALDAKASKLLDSYLEGVVPVEAYREKADEIAAQRATFERRRSSLAGGQPEKTSLVEYWAKLAMGIQARFAEAGVEDKRFLLDSVLLNARLEDGSIASYQLKHPFEVLRRDLKGAFCNEWWAILDLNQ
ncbi:MAG TPA: recombinase family protein, partial [Coriobacteriia bacterium]|nr:recombinase family protein [Coriobacteriia bacterium]